MIQCPKCYTQNPKETTYCNKCGTDLEEDQETLSYISSEITQLEEEIHLSPGDEFGERYRIIEEIGRGGMGRVYKADDLKLDITVAIKLIRPKYSADPHFIEMFKKETLTARSISHDNIIRIYDLGEANNIKFISMEYIKGQNLKDLIRTSGSLTIKKAADIARQLCEALDAAHQKKIIHRDLKPSNIMIDNNGRVHVMDFGLAKSFMIQERLSSKSIVGTPRYFSPEQGRGEKLDQRSDIYSFGLIFYEMLTGKNEIPQNSSELNALIPPALHKLIMRCLEKKPEDRYQNVYAILSDIEKKKDLLHSIRQRTKKNRMLTYAFAVIVILAVIIFYPIIKSYIDNTSSKSRTDINSPIGEIGTDDPRARKFSIDAQQSFKDGDWEESIDLLEKAVDADPEFAMAYKDLAMAYAYLHSPLKSKEYMNKALSLVHKTTRRQRFLIRGYAAMMDKPPQEAIDIYQNLLKEYPNDEEGLLTLASIYRNLEQWDEAINQYERVLKINNKSVVVYNNLFYVYMARGLYDESRKILEDSQILFSNQARIYRLIAHTYICQREFDLAREEVDLAISIDPDNSDNIWLLGNICHIEGNIESARDYYSSLLENSEPVMQMEGHLWLGNLNLLQGSFRNSEDEFKQGLYISQELKYIADEQDVRLALTYLKLRAGNYEKALQELEQVIDFTVANDLPSEQKWALLLRGIAYVALNNLDYANTTAEELQQLIEQKGYPKERRLFFLLRGIILLKQDRIFESLDYLNRACELLPSEVFTMRDQALYYDFLAKAYYASGDLENSRIQYEKITALTMGKLDWGDIFVRSFFWLGKIHEKSGRKEEARHNYETFLDLWKDADPEIPEIMQARKQLEELR